MGKKHKRIKRETLISYLMIAPEMILMLIFIFIPIVYAFYISLFDWNAMGTKTFVGISNYLKMMQDLTFKSSLLVTEKYALIYVLTVYVLSLAAAVFVNSIRSNKRQQACRIGIYLPNTVSTIVAATLWTFLFNSRNGYINKILDGIGVGRQLFLGSRSQALICVAIVGIWVVFGYNMIIFLSALKDVPSEYYEAAKIDGANAVQRFFKITLPSIKGTTIFVLVTSLIASFQAFDQIRVMTSGGPGKTTEVTVYYIFQLAFEQYRFGYASTIAVSLSLIIMVVTVIQMKLLRFK